MSFVHDERLRDDLKLGSPVMVVRAVHPLKQLVRFVAACPKSFGSVRDSRALHPVKQ